MGVLRTFLFLTFSVLISVNLRAETGELTHNTIAEVTKVAKAISAVNPFLVEGKYFEYALGIVRASKRFDIDPHVLIAITQQETAFRENLPEGKAGEIGICQILKTWLNHSGFKKEFGAVKQKDLSHPARAFQYAAWILKGLRTSNRKGTLPYWSFYNSVRFENRFKYFLYVNRYMAMLRRASLAKSTQFLLDTEGDAGLQTSQADVSNRWSPN